MKRLKTIFVATGPLLIAVFACSCEKLAIVSEGKSNHQIVLPDEGGDANVDHFLNETATLIQSCVKEATGVALPVVRESEMSADKHGIFLGATKAAQRAGVDPTSLKGWEYRIKALNGNVFIVGVDQPGKRDIENFTFHRLGTAKAATDFLESALGARFVMPGADGVVVPATNELSIPADLDVRRKPKMDYCASRNKEIFYDLANNFLPNIDYGTHGGHSHNVAIPVETYGEAHPEYFALWRRKRLVNPDRPEYCLSNPMVRELIYQELLNHADKGYDVVQLGQPDGYIPCSCPHCEELYGTRPTTPPGTRGYHKDPAWGEKLWIAHREMAARFLKDRPGKRLAIMAYGPAVHPPKTFSKFPANTTVEMAHYDDDAFAEWNEVEIPGGFFVYIYNWGKYKTEGFTPKQTPTYIADQAKRFHANNVKGVYRCGFGELFGTEGPVYYVYGRLLGNPDLDADAVLDEYYHLCYGEKAAAAMKRFFDLLHQRLEIHANRKDDWNDPDLLAGKHAPVTQQTRIMRSRYPADVVEKLDALLSEAEKLVPPNSKEAKRLRTTRIEFDHLKHTAAALNQFTVYRGDPSKENFARLRELVEQRTAFINSLFPGKNRMKRRSPNIGSIPTFGTSTYKDLLHGVRLKNTLKIPFDWDFERLAELNVNPGKRDLTVKWSDSDDARTPENGEILLPARLEEDDETVENRPTYASCAWNGEDLTVTFKCEKTTVSEVTKDGFSVFLAPDDTGERQLRFTFKGKNGPALMYELLKKSKDNDWRGNVYWHYRSNIEGRVAVSTTPGNQATIVEIVIPLKVFDCPTPQPGETWRANFSRTRKTPEAKYVWQPMLVCSSDRGAYDALGEITFGGDRAKSQPPVRSETTTVPENLLKDGDFQASSSLDDDSAWRGRSYIHGKIDAKKRDQILATITRSIVEDDANPSNRLASLRNHPDSLKFRDEKRHPGISNRLQRSVSIPEADGRTRYRLKFKQRVKDSDTHFNQKRLTLFASFGGARKIPVMIQRGFPLSSEWETASQLIIPPAGTRRINLTFAFYEIGDLQLDDLELVEEQP